MEVKSLITDMDNFEWMETGLVGNLLEANAHPFPCRTGVIKIAIRRTAGGGATAGVITLYQEASPGDAIYTVMPGAQYSLVTATSRISQAIEIGPGNYKFTVAGFAGALTYDLGYQEVHA
jgi:hypothetical protein